MKKEAIEHRAQSEMAFSLSDKLIVIRLKCAKGDIKSSTLLFGDRADRINPIKVEKVEMKLAFSDLYHDWFEARLETSLKRICYAFELIDYSDERVFFYGDQLEKELPDARSEFFQIPYNHLPEGRKVPSWLNSSIVYNIFPDSFASSKRFISKKVTGSSSLYGGTLKGIIDNIDYLYDLGINTLYLNPIFKAGEYHKYDTIDYFEIDPSFGTKEELKVLVQELHKRGMKLILDGVFNHIGWHHPFFEDVVLKGKESMYWSFFNKLEDPVIVPPTWEEIPSYECFGYERMMPKTATHTPFVSDYFVDVGTYWVKEFDIDGWRLDVADEVTDSFWRRFRTEIKSIKPDCILIGEIWTNSSHWLDGTMFDSVMNYDFWRHAKRFFAYEDINALEYNHRLVNMLTRYSESYVFSQLNLLDSHDVSRFFSLVNRDIRKYKLALVMLFTFPGVPMVFYGDEKGMTGIDEVDFRAPMAWNNGNEEISNFFKELIKIRKSYSALKKGRFETIFADESGTLSFLRKSDNDEIKVTINRNLYPISVEAGTIILQEGYNGDNLLPYGFVISKEV